jgi:hypothetical protein
MKTIIIKNNTPGEILLSSLGFKIPSSQQIELNYEDLLEIQNSTEFFSLIDDGTLVMNDGSKDLSPTEAHQYISFETDLSNYYNKDEVDTIASERSPLNHTHDDRYYTEGEIDSLISGIEGYGIVGGVDDVNDLPENYTGNIGDIYIVRMSIGQGSGTASPYTTNTDTGLYLPMETTWEDELGHSGESNSSMTPVSSPLTPPFGTKYCDFDGQNDYLEFDENSDFGEGPTLTVGGWIHPREGGNRGIIGRWDDGDGWKIDLFGNKLRASLDTLSMSPVQFRDPNSISLNEWTHVAMVYDGNYCILYRNATEVNRVSASGTTIDSDDEDVLVGKWSGEGDGSKYFNGGMKDFFIQNSAMTQEQLQNLVQGGFESFADEGFYQWDGNEWIFLARNTGDNGGGSGSSYHNSLLGLNSDDYQHLTESEKLDLTDGGNTSLHTHDDRYYTESEIDSQMSGKSNSNHTHDDRYYTESEINTKLELKYSDISSNDPDTNITGEELEQLTNGSNADHLHTHAGSSGGGGTGGLDDAYNGHNQYGRWGEGREINVDYGPVKINASGGFAPLRLTPIDYKPTQWLGGGELCIYDNELFVYDDTRSKWISVSGNYIGGGINATNVKNTYLRGYNGASFTDNVGWAAHWDGVVVSFSITSDNDNYNSVQIRKNGSSIYELWYNNGKENHSTNIDVTFSAGDVLNFYVNGNGNRCNRPQVWAIIKRRI